MDLCLGTVQFGLNYGIQGNGQPREEKVFEMLSFAINNGIRVMDTASAYGDAEAVLGEYVRLYPEKIDKVRFVSKLKPDAFTKTNEDKWSDIAIKNAAGSLDRLGIGKLYAYLFHNTSYVFNLKAVEAMNTVKGVGLAERIGVSIYTPEEAMKALEYPEIDVIQIPYNLFDHRLDQCGFFMKAKAQDVTVFARSSLLQGLLMMNPDRLPENVSFAKGYLEKLQEICSRYELTKLDTAISYVGNKNEIDYVVFGVDNIKQLQEYISMKDTVLPGDMIDDINRTFENVEERLVNPVLWK